MTREEFNRLVVGDQIKLRKSVMQVIECAGDWIYFLYVSGPYEGNPGCMAWDVSESMSRWQKVQRL